MSASNYHWNGLSALYQDHERTFILGLIAGDHRDEAEFIHELKATFDGTLEEGDARRGSEDGGRTPDRDKTVHFGSDSPSSSAPTGHGAFQIPKRVLGQLAQQDVTDRDREREGA